MGSIHSALRLLAMAARIDALAAAVNKASTASQNSRDLLIPAVTIIPLPARPVSAGLTLSPAPAARG